MALFRNLLFLGAILLPVSASAVTVRDIIELSKAGLSDDILVALIDADRTIFALDKDQILELKKAGVSKAVLLKMLKTRKEFAEPAETAAPVASEMPQPEVVVTDPPPAPPPVTVVVPQYVVPQYVVPQYFVVPYSIWGPPSHRTPRTPPPPVLAPEYRGFGRFINDGWVNRP